VNIYFTGASGTGKTTLANLLAPEYDMKVMPSISRSSPHPIGGTEHQQYISEKLFRLAMQDQNAVFDRTPLDVVGYDLAYGFPELATQSTLYATVWKRTNPILIYFPVYWTPEDDGFRPTDEKTTTTVDLSIRVQLTGLEYLTVENESPELRLKSVMEYIKSREASNADLRVQK
jgi:hypothetical protein